MSIAPCDMVSNARLCEAFLRLQATEGLTSWVLANRLGWDEAHVRRMLGLKSAGGASGSKRQRSIAWSNVGPLCRAMGVLPTDLDY